MTTIATQLRVLRRELKLTQEQFAAALGETQRRINAMENGRLEIPLSLILSAHFLAEREGVRPNPMDETVTIGRAG